jgi:PleD family two-component response regulator
MKKTILLIESDTDALALLKEILEDKGHSVFGTVYIEKAFAILSQGIKIDVIMVSTYLEKAESLSVVQRFQGFELSNNIPIIGIVQSAQTTDTAVALRAGCCAVVAKPIDESELDQALQHCAG